MDRDSLEARAPDFWPLVGPSFVGTAVQIIGLALELLGPGGPEKRFLTRIPSTGKESWSVRGGETSDASLVGKDRDCGRISRDVMWWRIKVGAETQTYGCLPRFHRPYKTKGFAPRVLYFASLPLHLQHPSPIA